jgi:hypothetical protein
MFENLHLPIEVLCVPQNLQNQKDVHYSFEIFNFQFPKNKWQFLITSKIMVVIYNAMDLLISLQLNYFTLITLRSTLQGPGTA